MLDRIHTFMISVSSTYREFGDVTKIKEGTERREKERDRSMASTGKSKELASSHYIAALALASDPLWPSTLHSDFHRLKFLVIVKLDLLCYCILDKMKFKSKEIGSPTQSG